MVPLLEKIVQTGRLASSYLFVGSQPEVLKEEALLFAKKILGENSKENLITLAPEKNSLKIEAIRDLTNRLSLKPMSGEIVLVLIEEAENLTEAAANALLKTLEEPPAYAHFLLLTSIPERLPLTIRSRCQKITIGTNIEDLKKSLDQYLPLIREKIYPEVNHPLSFSKASSLAELCTHEVEDYPLFFETLKAWWRDLIVYQETKDRDRLHFVSPLEIKETTKENHLFEGIGLIDEAQRAIEGNVLKQLALEQLFLRLS